MKEGDVLICIKENSSWFYGKEVKFTFGEKCIASDVRKSSAIISNSKGGCMFFYVSEIEDYFETIAEHRKRIIEDLFE